MLIEWVKRRNDLCCVTSKKLNLLWDTQVYAQTSRVRFISLYRCYMLVCLNPVSCCYSGYLLCCTWLCEVHRYVSTHWRNWKPKVNRNATHPEQEINGRISMFTPRILNTRLLLKKLCLCDLLTEFLNFAHLISVILDNVTVPVVIRSRPNKWEQKTLGVSVLPRQFTVRCLLRPVARPWTQWL